MVLPPGKDLPMPRPKLQSLTIATARCLLTLCVFGLFIGPEVAAQRASQRAMEFAKSRNSGKISTGQAGEVPFGIRGRVRGLYPGARKPLTVRLRNPHRFPIEVRSLGVKVRRSDHAGCGHRWVRPKRAVTISVLVPPRSKAFVSYPVRMRKAAPEVCNGATWRLRFIGKGARP